MQVLKCLALMAVAVHAPNAATPVGVEPQGASQADTKTETKAEAETAEGAASAFVTRLTEQVFAMMDDDGQSAADRQRQLSELINRYIGLDFLARLMLSSEFRQLATPEQLQRYRTLAKPYLTQMFSDRIAALGSRKLAVTETSVLRRGDVMVRTQLRRKDGSTVDVDWRVRNPEHDPQIINLSANGVSLIILKREEFSTIARAEGVQGLLTTMAEAVSSTADVDSRPPRS